MKCKNPFNCNEHGSCTDKNGTPCIHYRQPYLNSEICIKCTCFCCNYESKSDYIDYQI